MGLMHAARTPALHERRHHALVREIALATVAALTYFGVRNLTVGAEAEAFANADRVERLEVHARIAWEQPLQDAVLGQDSLVTMLNWIYIWGHWPVIITTAVLLYRLHPERYVLLRNAMSSREESGFSSSLCSPSHRLGSWTHRSLTPLLSTRRRTEPCNRLG